MLWKQLLQKSLIAVVLLTAIEAGAQVPGNTGSVGGESRGITFFRGTIVCAGCSLEAAQAANPHLGHLYAFNSDHGQVVLNMDDADERMWWETTTGLSDRVWLRGPDQVLSSLLAEENLFKKVEVAGLLRKEGVFDVGSVTFLG
jgi:hypothetical protein